MAIGPWQIVIIALLILVLFGASRIADIGKGLGEGIRNFKRGIADDGDGEPKDPKQLASKSEKQSEGAAESKKQA